MMNNLAAKTERGSQPVKRRLIMTRRKTHQKGSVKLHCGSWTLRYRELDHTTGRWKICRYVLGKFKDKKDALKASEPIMARINERNNNPESSKHRKELSAITFRQFVEGQWKAYTVTARHEPSTLHQRASLMNQHIMPFLDTKDCETLSAMMSAIFLRV
jgi:hypothetical protein